jgi:D-alanyl-D-alanine carboxypeptidase/D-alanyl-D-alanine-endopeptidase (penicillin-binding protein 4)
MKSLLLHYKYLALLLLITLNFCPAYAKSAKAKKSVSSSGNIKEILNKHNIASSDVSLQILNGDDEIYSLNANTSKIPASVSKVMTSYAILKHFPPGHRFYTQLFYDGKNLYLKGGGDPSFVSENMWFLVNEFTRSGIKAVNDIIVDDSLFDDVRYDQTRESTRVDRAYDAPVGAMSFNWNSVNIFVRPTEVNKKAKITVDPQSGYFDLVNNATTVSFVPKNDVIVNISNSEKLITVTGDVGIKSAEKAIFKNVESPDMWSGVNLKFFLSQRGISVDGKIKNGLTPSDADLVASYESKNLAYILGDMNKFSNNFVAEMLTKGLAVEPGKRATLKQGVEIIKEELKKIGLDEKQITFINPSGLTRDNKFSAASLNKVLTAIKDDFSIFPAFVDSLPIAGIDGTLKKRFKGTDGEGWIRAKTGYLNNVVALAGYAGRRDGQVLTFSFLYNGPRDEGIVREAFDQILISRLK